MNLITIDFETYYDKEFSLSKMTTEEYVRDPRFEVIGVGVKFNDDPPEWASGTHEELKLWLDKFPWRKSMTLAHNAIFDGSILNWVFDIRPNAWADTLCMGRAIHGVEVSSSLAALAEREQVGIKGLEILTAAGKRRADFSATHLERYGDYCLNDVDLTFKLFKKLLKSFPIKEMKLIDITTRMFTEPVLRLDARLLRDHLHDLMAAKEKLLEECGASVDDLMSNPKLAELLMKLGVEPPTKTSLTTGKPTLAFAKNDPEFLALTEHEDWRVQTLIAARLGLKSTLEETRTRRFIEIAERGPLPVPLKYYAAHTGRFGGMDKINLQNLPARGENANKLKKAVRAPEGYSIIDSDSAQIEARVLAWLAGQTDLVKAFAEKQDVYKKMASAIYNKPEEDVTKSERFVGKTTILGCGYGMGAVRFREQLKTAGVEVEPDEARRIVDTYRSTNHAITALWRQAQACLVDMSRRDISPLGVPKILSIVPNETSILLPSGLLLRYDELRFEESAKGGEFTYKTRKGRVRIYGGKVIENVCQAIARCIIGEQMLRIARKYRVVMTVHDAITCVVPDSEVAEAQTYVEECMCWVPDWADGLPLNCESGVGKSYGDC